MSTYKLSWGTNGIKEREISMTYEYFNYGSWETNGIKEREI
jgi:hypothetical protein